MLKLCYKDYLAGRWFWLASSVLYALYVVQPLGSSILLMAFGPMLVLANLNIPLFIEDKDKTEILYAGLPLTRADIVRGRHLLAALLLAGSGLLIFGAGAAVKTVFRSPAYQAILSPLLTVEGAAGYLLAGGLLYAGFLPLYHKLGLGRGNIVFTLGALVILGAAAGIERLASQTWKIIPPLFTTAFLKDPGKGIVEKICGVRSAIGTPLFALTAAALVAALFFFSIRLSTRFYERREF